MVFTAVNRYAVHADKKDMAAINTVLSQEVTITDERLHKIWAGRLRQDIKASY
jgi:hypothetical protein